MIQYKEIFQDYQNGNISKDEANKSFIKACEEFEKTGNAKEAEKARICSIFILRERQLSINKISKLDFLLFLRDFILFVGRFKPSSSIRSLIKECEQNLSLFEESDGYINTPHKYPDWLSNHEFIDQTYILGEDYVEDSSLVGDSLLIDKVRYKKYKSVEQKVAAHSAIKLPNGYTMFISLPTGAGKSLVTQLLAATENRLTLVIVPTVALGLDQHEQASKAITDIETKRGIFCYRSGMKEDESSKILYYIRNKTARLLFTSPEAVFKKTELNQVLKKAVESGYLHNIVVDETHMVTDWGVNFRTEFQLFSVLLRSWRKLSINNLRTYLLSATLSDEVVEVLKSLFVEDNKYIEYRCDALRIEPRFIIDLCKYRKTRNEHLIELVKSMPKPLIIYAIRPLEAEAYKELLVKAGLYNISTFTGETDEEQRYSILNAWKNNQIDIMVATSAFGIGVDKGNVRTVIHACVPENLSRFYQEVGRGGRDGLPSLSIIMPYLGRKNDTADEKGDIDEAFSLCNKSILTTQALIARWHSMMIDSKTEINGDIVTVNSATIPEYFDDEAAERAGSLNMNWNVNVLLTFHRQRYIELQDVWYSYKAKAYMFKLRIKDIDLINNLDSKLEEIDAVREKEFKLRTAGFESIRLLVYSPAKKCWGARFAEMYSLSTLICNGCPVHPAGKTNLDEKVKIRKSFEIENIKSEVNSTFKRRLRLQKTLFLPKHPDAPIEIDEICEKLSKFNLSCIVVPSSNIPVTIQKTLILTHEAFLEVGQKASWLFNSGIAIVFGKDNHMNNALFETAYSDKMKDYCKILIGSEKMIVNSDGREIQEFLECTYDSLEML